MTPPAFKGGQGRSARSVRADATSVAFTLALALLFGLYVVARIMGWGA